MSIFITRPPPQPSLFREGGRQAKCPYLPCALSFQPKKRGSVKRRQFPWNIRIKRTWKEGKGWKGKLITQKWLRNIWEKRQGGSSGEGRADLGFPFANESWMKNFRTQVERVRLFLHCVLWEPVWKTSAITLKNFLKCLQHCKPRRHLHFTSLSIKGLSDTRDVHYMCLLYCTGMVWYTPG